MTPRTVPTAADVDRNVLQPAGHSLTANRRQDVLIDQPETPEPDSALELVALATQNLQMAAEKLRLAGKFNRMEAGFVGHIANWGDGTVTCLRHAERVTREGSGIPGHELGDHIKALLDDLDDGTPDPFSLSLHDLFHLFAAFPEHRLFEPAVQNRLRPKRIERLRGLYDTWCQRQALRVSRVLSDPETAS